MTVNFAARIAAVRAVGAAEVKRDKIAQEILDSAPAGFDWSARGARIGMVHLWATGTDIKAEWPEQRVTRVRKDEDGNVVHKRDEDGNVVVDADGKPVPETVTERTNYGRGVANIDGALKNLLADEDNTPKAFRLAVTASGEGPVTGTVVVSPDHPLFAALVELVAGQTGE